MKTIRSISVDLSVRNFIRSARAYDDGSLSDIMTALLQDLLHCGCDYYDLLDVYTEQSVSNQSAHVFLVHAPVANTIVIATFDNIRENIYRWSPSKHHTDSISAVVDRIRNLVSSPLDGVHVFNSNHNSSNRRAVNDKYVLLVSKDRNLFFDISRKRTVIFIPEEKVWL